LLPVGTISSVSFRMLTIVLMAEILSLVCSSENAAQAVDDAAPLILGRGSDPIGSAATPFVIKP
jgi:hypothetical protein